VTVRFGKPLDFSRYSGMQDSLPVLRSVTDQIVYNILELSGQDYVDNYQASATAA
jgi:1-acyl-sn-glycerol-3-phosphate acyltransferase